MRSSGIANIVGRGALPSRAGESRLGPVTALPELLLTLGVAPEVAFRRAGVSFKLFGNPENRIAAVDFCRLLATCGSMAGRSDIGLLLGQTFSLRGLGALGELMLNSATVAEAMRMLVMHLHFQDRAAIPLMFRLESASVFLGYSLYQHDMEGTEFLQDTAITVAYRLMRELCGPAWVPQSVRFSHRAPESTVTYRRIFGRHVYFDSEFSGLFFDPVWLEKPIDAADPSRARELNALLQRTEAGVPIGFAEEVQCILHGLLAGGAVSASSVAQLFGFSDRTLRQKLRIEGTSIQQLLAETRFELARHLLQNTRLPMSRVAAALCYADTAVFCRAFHGWTGVSPLQWRKVNN